MVNRRFFIKILACVGLLPTLKRDDSDDWHMATGTWRSDAERKVYLNDDLPPDARAELHMWNVALTDAEIDSLANGADPYGIRPEHLITL